MESCPRTNLGPPRKLHNILIATHSNSLQGLAGIVGPLVSRELNNPVKGRKCVSGQTRDKLNCEMFDSVLPFIEAVRELFSLGWWLVVFVYSRLYRQLQSPQWGEHSVPATNTSYLCYSSLLLPLPTLVYSGNIQHPPPGHHEDPQGRGVPLRPRLRAGDSERDQITRRQTGARTN